MLRTSRTALALSAGVLFLFGTGCDKLKSRDNLNKGVAAFKGAKYSDAVTLFKEAIRLDPDNPNARLYLATAYMVQWIPGAASPENDEFAKNARDTFMQVYNKDPKDKTAIASLASLSFNEGKAIPAEDKTRAERVAKFNEAKDWYTKLLEVDPKDKTAYYSLGVIVWEKWYPVLMNARAKMSMKPDDPGPLKDKKVREQLRAEYSPLIDDGIAKLEKALEVDPLYDDAMAYLNLLHRERADLAETPDEYKKEIETADSLVTKALDARKVKNEKANKQNSGIVAK
ncbi:MAG TPA: tetratricopeptide repeat protein [Bryobacteraceae bacterium]|jgi:tetratricopeptide (TPR) repeat protein